MHHFNSIVCIDDARLENDFGSRLTDADLASVCHFLDQLEQVDLVLHQSRVAVIGPNIFDDHLTTTQERESYNLA